MITLTFKFHMEPKGSNELTEEGIDIVAHELLKRLNQNVKPNIISANVGCFVEVTKVEED